MVKSLPAFKTENAAKDAGNKLLREFWRGPGRPKSIEGEEQKKTDGSDGRERESVGDQRRMIQLGRQEREQIRIARLHQSRELQLLPIISRRNKREQTGVKANMPTD